MSKMIITPEMALRLSAVKEMLEIRDAEGKLIGYFEPPRPKLPEGRTLDEILRDAGFKD